MEILELTAATHDRCVQRMVEGAHRGELILFPTDTVYGLGGTAFSDAVMEKLKRVKPDRPLKPTAVLIDNIIRMGQCAGDVPGRKIIALAEAFWPGSLTLVWKMSKAIPPHFQTADLSLGYRVPDHPFLLDVLRELEAPLWATSANLPGQPPPRIFSEVKESVAQACDLVIKTQALPRGKASSVVDVRGRQPVMIRESSLREEDIRKAWRQN
jgi:L-threonylcarbamoyladenylate synthase